MSLSHDLPSDPFNSPQPSSEPDPAPNQIQLDPSTLSQVLTGAIQLAQSAGSTASKMTKARKPRKPKEGQPKPRSPRKSKPKHRDTQSDKSKDLRNIDESSQDEVSKSSNKTTVQWDHDDNGQGKTSMYLLLSWLTDELNFGRFKDNKSEKRAVAEEIERYMVDNGISWRDANSIRKKIARLEDAWRKAEGLRNRTGAGSWMTAQEVKAASGWDDDNPEWLKLEKVALAPILKQCKYFFELEPVFGTRHANVRLASARGLPALTEETQEASQRERDEREHSVASNEAYEEAHNSAGRNFLDSSLCPGFSNDDLIHGVSEVVTVDDFRNDTIATEDILEEFQAPYTPTPLRASLSSQSDSHTRLSASNLKRSVSKNSLDSGPHSTLNKKPRASGSANSIQALLHDERFGSTPARSGGLKKTLEEEAFVNHGHSMDRLAQVVENMGASLYGQQPTQAVLSPEEVKMKSKIELEMADVKLSSEKFDLDSRKEKHTLEMKQMKAEFEHQQVARNAQLISTLMRDHNLSIQDAMLAAQHAQSMMQSTSGS